MALIGNIDKISDMFIKNDALKILYDYLLEATQKDSRIYNRILSLDCGDNRMEMKYNLGFDMVAIEQSYRLGGESRFESHKKYVDFQLLVNAKECMEVGDSKNFKVISEYDNSKDVVFYEKINDVSKIFLTPKTLLVLFPYDIHAGGFFIDKNIDIVYKSVVKVPYPLLQFRF
ncbi:hypothetical protein CCY99_05525 [Helicobacter sp. 16-1353]|uniref:YhcH/YjgK/YiaL family protein n=1 Tax=Helicobacter sp. 16-1353 TaxID=2004996 RepID=UPI000DCEE893|nr:YhcH/YjgK/YiaL family protein [Helicobacter sp. 16-1353]RAX53841.1 hypothetical protein CCY99_05525 [Helicobacter sp. 16-1353]